MKKNIHPDYHEIVIVMTNGDRILTRSTYGKPGSELVLDIDYKTHPAWTGSRQGLMRKGGRLERFEQRYGSSLFDKES